MADFSPSGIYGLPQLTADTLAHGGDPKVLGWVLEQVQEGDRLNQEDPAYPQAEQGMRYIIGEQTRVHHPDYVPWAVINKSRKSVQAHVSALTDIKPVFGFRALDKNFSFHSDLLNQLTVAWWVEAQADITLGDVIKYGLAGGTADLAIEWDPSGGYGMGDHAMIAKDFRDTLPFRPGNHPNPQYWQGVTFREAHAVNAMRAKYPQYQGAFRPAPDTLLTTIMARFRRVISRIQTPSDTLSGLSSQPQGRPVRPGDVVLYRTYLNDATRNLTSKPIVMGNPLANWSYVVEPGDLLYPQKRLIVTVPDSNLILYDGPNTYWHGMFPFSRLRLWSVPWCFLGLSLLHDTIPLQDGINDTMKDLRLGLKQWVDPDVVYDRSATSRNVALAAPTNKPGKKIGVSGMTASATKAPWDKIAGPNPQVLSLLLDTYRQLCTEHDEQTGVANLQSLLQLRQLPGADTIQKYYEALTPELRQEGRNVEAFLRDVAQMFKFNIFQHETSARRRNILGDAALALEDFDYDPDTLVPSMQPYEETPDPQTGIPSMQPVEGYKPELDASKSRTERAKWFARMFVFTVSPNSILAMSAQERKMMTFQLSRAGYVDFWTLHEAFETPNVGNPPPIPLPPLQPVDQSVLVQQMVEAKMAMAAGQPPPPPKYLPGPNGEVLELRVPMTITERLQAQQMLGIGMTENPAGRKASGQQAPQAEEKSDGEGGTRQTVTESSK